MEIKKFDKSNMRKTILNFPQQFRVGLEAAKKMKVSGIFDKVLVCGMGGSALPGDILSIWLETYKIGLPLYIHRNYGLPQKTDLRTLVICISYSGNTEETLAGFEEARGRKFKIAAIASGGKLAELCQKYKIPIAIIPQGLQPRMALGLQFAALMKILSNCGVIENELKNILALKNLLKPQDFEAQGKKLAKNLFKKIPIIYASRDRRQLAYIWKVSLNETAKIIAEYNFIPELCHNEIVGFWKINEMQIPGKKLYTIFLRDPAAYPRILTQMEIARDLIEKEGVKTEIIEIKGKDILEKIFSNIILGFWTSYHLALLYKVDPTPIKMIEEFKKRLATS